MPPISSLYGMAKSQICVVVRKCSVSSGDGRRPIILNGVDSFSPSSSLGSTFFSFIHILGYLVL